MPSSKYVIILTTLSCSLAFPLSFYANSAAAKDAASPSPTAITAALPVTAAPLYPDPAKQGEPVQDDPIVIDNDSQEVEAEYEWKEVPDGPGKTHITQGARFPVSIQSQISSKNAKVGDPIEARLKIDIKIGGRLIAPKGALVLGHVVSVRRARKLLAAELTPTKRWLRMAGSIGIQFDEIITDRSEHIPLVAKPARNPRIVNNSCEGRVMGVNSAGQVASPLSGQLKCQVLHIAIRAGAAAGGVFSFGIVPATYACIGAIDPSFAYMQPVGKNVRHRRLKGFGMGLVGGLPGGFLITDSIIRGPEAVIQPGDTFEAEFKQDFTGETATQANLLPNVKTGVHGQILPTNDKK